MAAAAPGRHPFIHPRPSGISIRSAEPRSGNWIGPAAHRRKCRNGCAPSGQGSRTESRAGARSRSTRSRRFPSGSSVSKLGVARPRHERFAPAAEAKRRVRPPPSASGRGPESEPPLRTDSARRSDDSAQCLEAGNEPGPRPIRMPSIWTSRGLTQAVLISPRWNFCRFRDRLVFLIDPRFARILQVHTG